MKKLNLLRSPVLAFVALVTMLGMSGIVYAHWFTQADVGVNVNTGGVGVFWAQAGTDDDGDPVNDPSGSDDNVTAVQLWDNWGEGSSADPRENWPYGGNGLQRYDKDVAACWVNEMGGSFLGLQIENGYPSYHCNLFASLAGDGSVPVKTAGMFINPEEFTKMVGWDPDPGDRPVCGDEQGNWIDNNEDDCETASFDEGIDVPAEPVSAPLEVEDEGNGWFSIWDGDEKELTFRVTNTCGVQIDPLFDDPGELEPNFWISVHVEQDADQWTPYSFGFHPRFVNWNEFSRELCGVVIGDDGNGSSHD